MPPQAAPGRPDRTSQPEQDDPGGTPAQAVTTADGKLVATVRGPADRPTLPGRSRDDSDVGWGERPEPDDDDERLYRERPPHWDSA